MSLSKLGDAIENAKVVNGAGVKPNKKAKRQAKTQVKSVVAKPSPAVPPSGEPTASTAKFNFEALKARAPQLSDPGRRRHIPSPEELAAKKALLRDFSRDVGPFMHDNLGQAWQVLCAPEEDAAEYAEGKEAIEADIRSVLDADEMYRLPGLVAFADAMISTAPAPHEFRGVMGVIFDWLRKEGFLKAGTGIGIKHAGTNYVLTEKLYGRKDAEAVLDKLRDLQARAAESRKIETKAELQNLRALAADSLILFDQFVEGQEGSVILEVPDQVVRENTYRGGTILFSSSDGRVVIVDGAGAIRPRCINLAESGASIRVNQIMEKDPNFNGERWRDQLGIHGLLRRYIDSRGAGQKTVAEAGKPVDDKKAKFKASCDAEYDALKADETITFDQFFAGETGKYALKMSVFNGQGKPVWYAMALIERLADGRIQFLRAPARLKEFFAGVGTKPVEPGVITGEPSKTYAKVAEPLRGMLRASLAGYQNRMAATPKEAVTDTPVAKEASDAAPAAS